MPAAASPLRDELLPRARELSAQGLSDRQIAAQLGISPSTLHNWRDPERKRKRDRDYYRARTTRQRCCDRCGESWYTYDQRSPFICVACDPPFVDWARLELEAAA